MVLEKTDFYYIDKCIEFWKKKKFTHLQKVPWIVPTDTLDITRPEQASAFLFQNNTGLVGSAEQSLLHLVNKGILAFGSYVAFSPCFRDDPESWIHCKEFLKVELNVFVSPDNFKEELPEQLINSASIFFLGLTGKKPDQVQTKDSELDLEYNGIEIGSYGYRRHGNLCWYYGTGIAFPRLRMALNAYT